MADDSDREQNEAAGETEAGLDAPDVRLSLNATLEILAHHHRREILCILTNAPDHTATVDELINREAERTDERPGHDEIEVAIHHVHLPKMADAGVVEYDARSQELRYWRNDRLEDLLEYVQSEEPN